MNELQQLILNYLNDNKLWAQFDDYSASEDAKEHAIELAEKIETYIEHKYLGGV